MKRLSLLAVGALASLVLVAVTSLLFPGLVEAVAPAALVPPAESRSDAAEFLLPEIALLAVVAAAYALKQLDTSVSSTPIVDYPVEAGTSDAVGTAGRRFRQERTWAAHEWPHPEEREKVTAFVERLRTVAADTYAMETGVDAETARHAVQTGTWTDDRVAAWFLAAPDADVQLPLASWLRVRFRPTPAFDSLVDRTAAAIDDLRGDH